MDFIPKLIRINRGHHILIKGKIHQDGSAIFNNYVLNTRVLKSIEENTATA